MDKKNHSKAETTINHTTTNVKSKLQIPIPWKKKIVKIFVNFLKKIKEIPKINNIITWQISALPLAQRPSNQERPINHRDLPNITHKIHSLHSPDRVQIPTPTQTPIHRGISQKENL